MHVKRLASSQAVSAVISTLCLRYCWRAWGTYREQRRSFSPVQRQLLSPLSWFPPVHGRAFSLPSRDELLCTAVHLAPTQCSSINISQSCSKRHFNIWVLDPREKGHALLPPAAQPRVNHQADGSCGCSPEMWLRQCCRSILAGEELPELVTGPRRGCASLAWKDRAPEVSGACRCGCGWEHAREEAGGGTKASGAAYLTALSLCLKSNMFCAENADDRARKEVIKVSRNSVTQGFQPFSLCICTGVHTHCCWWDHTVCCFHASFPRGVSCMSPSGAKTRAFGARCLVPIWAVPLTSCVFLG